MLIVADSSALVALATCNALDFLTTLYDDIKVPQAVYDEVIVPDKPEARSLAQLKRGLLLTAQNLYLQLVDWGEGK